MPQKTTRRKSLPFVTSPLKSLRIPRVKLNKSLYVPVLVVLLVLASFLIGMLLTKVSYLEKGVGTVAVDSTGAAGDPQAAAPTPGAPVDVSVGHLPVKGQDSAKVTVIEFADFQCPFCEQWFTDVETNLIKDYVDTGKVKFAFRHYAFLGQESTDAANASECANEQNKFWEYHDYLYQHQGAENSGAFSKDHLKEFAAALGLDSAQFNNCLDTNKFQTNVDKDMKEGQTAGVSGTPATFVNGRMVSGAEPYANFKALIDEELAK